MGDSQFLRQPSGAWMIVDVLGDGGQADRVRVRQPDGAERVVLRSRLLTPARVDPSGPVALALRAIQKYDQLATEVEYRDLLVEAETQLGAALGLECTGEVEGEIGGSGHFYDHSGETCPTHEWLVPSDHDLAEGMR